LPWGNPENEQGPAARFAIRARLPIFRHPLAGSDIIRLSIKNLSVGQR